MFNNFALAVLLGIIFVTAGVGMAFGAAWAGYMAIGVGALYIVAAVFDF